MAVLPDLVADFPLLPPDPVAVSGPVRIANLPPFMVAGGRSWTRPSDRGSHVSLEQVRDSLAPWRRHRTRPAASSSWMALLTRLALMPNSTSCRCGALSWPLFLPPWRSSSRIRNTRTRHAAALNGTAAIRSITDRGSFTKPSARSASPYFMCGPAGPARRSSRCPTPAGC